MLFFQKKTLSIYLLSNKDIQRKKASFRYTSCQSSANFVNFIMVCDHHTSKFCMLDYGVRLAHMKHFTHGQACGVRLREAVDSQVGIKVFLRNFVAPPPNLVKWIWYTIVKCF